MWGTIEFRYRSGRLVISILLCEDGLIPTNLDLAEFLPPAMAIAATLADVVCFQVLEETPTNHSALEFAA